MGDASLLERILPECALGEVNGTLVSVPPAAALDAEKRPRAESRVPCNEPGKRPRSGSYRRVVRPGSAAIRTRSIA